MERLGGVWKRGNAHGAGVVALEGRDVRAGGACPDGRAHALPDVLQPLLVDAGARVLGEGTLGRRGRSVRIDRVRMAANVDERRAGGGMPDASGEPRDIEAARFVAVEQPELVVAV